MTVLVVGATGATGRLLVRQLLHRGLTVKVVVRSPDKLPDDVRSHSNLSVIQASVLDLSDAEMARHVNGCDAVASCLGHNLNLKGIYGPPRMLVTGATRRLCNAIKANKPDKPVRFVELKVQPVAEWASQAISAVKSYRAGAASSAMRTALDNLLNDLRALVSESGVK